MTLTAIRKMVFTLPKAQRVRLADELLNDAIVPFREPVTLAIVERRAEELRSGKVKGISDQEFEATLTESKQASRLCLKAFAPARLQAGAGVLQDMDGHRVHHHVKHGQPEFLDLNLADGFAAPRKRSSGWKTSNFLLRFADREEELLQRRRAAMELVSKGGRWSADMGERFVVGH